MITRARLGVAMGLFCFCFGCKGAGLALGGLKVATAVAVTAVRVAAVAAASSPSSGGGGREEEVAPLPPPPPPEAAPPAVTTAGCVEVDAAPEMPGDPFAVRTAVCGGRWVIVQDAQTGLWRQHR